MNRLKFAPPGIREDKKHAYRGREVQRGQELMSKTFPIIQWGCNAGLGASLFRWASQLSVRHNAWTTSLRERYPYVNTRPTSQMRELNTKIMKWIFRVVGAFFFLLSVVALIGVLNSK